MMCFLFYLATMKFHWNDGVCCPQFLVFYAQELASVKEVMSIVEPSAVTFTTSISKVS